ncbi:MAG: pectate lyase [Candidatus Symbiothrix sp.]|jgi:hypothetical protein|nr:pectate lyase [Candidatus Symbiothrix sp.]
MKHLISIFSILFLLFCWELSAQTPAFPGAEGHGRYTTGGRGGTVYYVTTLEDNSSSGSLRYAVTRSGARTILFKVSGTIQLNSELKIANGNLTIAGQSAPGDGICIGGYPVAVNADNVIIRYLRFRMGDAKDVNADGADALGGRFRSNIIIDHCSVSWSTDECCSFYNNSNFTLQWCLISESLRLSGHSKGAHGYGGIWGGMKASFHHNLMAHHGSRVPRLGPGANTTPTNELVDVRNNVYYNYDGEGCYGGEAQHVNIVNNYYKPGPANRQSANSVKRGRIIAIDKQTAESGNSFPNILDVWGTFYINGNVVDGHANATNDNWTYGVYNQINAKYGTLSQETKDALRLSDPLATDVITTHTAEKAYDQVLLYAGCSLHRDAIDERIVEETRTNTATYKGLSASNVSPYPRPGIIDSQNDLKPVGAGDDWSPYPTLNQTTPPADTNNDGIPDGWLETHYPGKQATDLNAEGYTCLEVYLNSLVAAITEQQTQGGSTTISTVNVPKGQPKQTQVYSLQGLLMPNSGLPAGIYIVREIFENGETSTKKVLLK